VCLRPTPSKAPVHCPTPAITHNQTSVVFIAATTTSPQQLRKHTTMAEIISALGELVEDFPPSYDESTSTTSSSFPRFSSGGNHHNNTHDASTSSPGGPRPGSTASSSLPLSSIFPSPISAHLSTLPAQMRAAQLAHANTQASLDLDIIDRLVPAISAFLSDLSASSSARGAPPLAELTLIPTSAVPARSGWALSDAAERRRQGEVVRVMRVDLGEPSSTKAQDGKVDRHPTDEKKNPSQRRRSVGDDDSDEGDGAVLYSDSRAAGFDEWGRFTDDGEDGLGAETKKGGEGTFFRDEKAARRLAAYLSPREVVQTERRVVQQVVVEAKKEKGLWRWGRKKSETTPAPASYAAPTPVVLRSPPPDTAIKGYDERINVGVRADEVTFRKENDWGMWETLTGFGIIVTVRVKKA